LEAFLDSEGLRDEVYAEAIKDVIAWQFEQARQSLGMTNGEVATAMGTGRGQINRVLAPENVAVSLDTLVRAAAALGKKLKIELVDL
jgi:transcriptional regulator with XRE-family HTH domain